MAGFVQGKVVLVTGGSSGIGRANCCPAMRFSKRRPSFTARQKI
jgi:NADP-dependent 3-hydroxy acid dehydrogenase YdfG